MSAMSACVLQKQTNSETKIPAEKYRCSAGSGVKLPEREFFHKGFFHLLISRMDRVSALDETRSEAPTFSQDAQDAAGF